ncbi:hypothetical protein [Azospirillum sp. B510]|uniref:hypothetical protein n=1 Tax=Azospirillum sp. (strain B510) TaxID=137722 RepID=UPI0002D8E337|nr:hypothetical protein [Azospirillum sp. B510]
MKLTYSDRTVDLLIEGADDTIRQVFVAEAQRQLAAAKEESQPDGVVQYVDGARGAPLESVKMNGGVLFEFYYTTSIVKRAIETLENTSPLDTGNYINHHEVFVDGALVTDLESLRTVRRVVIANTMNYSRIIERGMGKHVPWSKQPQVPAEGVYTAAAKTLTREFGQIADIALTWVEIDGQSGRTPALAIERRQ